jgi:hypothetical protein
VPLPRVVVPSRNFAVPEGVPAELVTVAVNVTDCPTVEGLSEEATVVFVAEAGFTVWVKAVDVLVAKFESPP